MSEPQQHPSMPVPPSGGYAPPGGYPRPGHAPFAAPYDHPAPGVFPAPPAPPSSLLGIVAFVVALTALIVPTALGVLAVWQIGIGAGTGIMFGSTTSATATEFDWSILSPVRGWVLLGEVSFWTGIVLAIWAIVQGIFALVTRRGRGLGIAAVAVGATSPMLFVGVVWIALWVAMIVGAVGPAMDSMT